MMRRDGGSSLKQEAKALASCTYENETKWGRDVGFMYHSTVEDYFTGFILHCKGWKSVYLNPPRPQFVGSSTTSLNDVLIQYTRWMARLFEVALSKFYPLIYGTCSLLSSSILPRLCLLRLQINFFSYSYLFLYLPLLNIYTRPDWMIKVVTYRSLNAIGKTLGLRQTNFLPTNKVENKDQVKAYQAGKFDFQTSTRLLAPLTTLVILNMTSFFVGSMRMVVAGGFDKYFVQVLLSFYILAVNYLVIEGMIIRKDQGRIPRSITLLSALFAMILLALGYVLLMY